jgi:hypothetical protein
MKDGLHWQHFHNNDAIVAAVRKWVASAGAAYRLLFIAGKIAWPVVVTMWKILFCSRKLALSSVVNVHHLSVVVSVEVNRRHFWKFVFIRNCLIKNNV